MRQRQSKAAATAEVEDVPFEGRLGISINETCAALNVARDKVYQLIAKGEPDGLTASQIGRRTIVHTASILRLLKRTRITMKPRVPRVRQGAVSQLPAP